MHNRNILIEDESHDTIDNVRTIVDFLREFHHEQQFSERVISKNSHVATAIILEWVGDALLYEHGKFELQEQELKKL